MPHARRPAGAFERAMILVVGAGAVGTVLAAHLCAAGREPVRLYMREKDRSAWEATRGLRVESPGGAMRVAVPLPELAGTLDLAAVDYLFICVKFAALEAMLDDLPADGAFPARCTIVSTLNGVEHLRVLRRRLPTARVVSMSVMFNAQLLGPLHARLTTKPMVVIGGDERRLSACFGKALPVQAAPGDAAVWGKLLINLANAVCAITHTTFKDLFTRPELRRIYVGVLDEAIGVLERLGIAYRLPMPVSYRTYRRLLLDGGPLTWWIARAKNGVSDQSYPSMVADVEQGRMTEVRQLNGEIVRLGSEHGVSTPVAAAVVRLIEAMEGARPTRYLTPAELLRQLPLVERAR
jgi:2-dehydropantoate 2-reductase